ncbi:MAG: cupin domain-containing protein [Candidatus Acidiferrales bacterium]
MNRRTFLAVSGGVGLVEPIFRQAPRLQASVEANQVPTNRVARQPVLVRSGFTCTSDGTDVHALSPSGMFDTEVVRSSDSEGRLAIFLFPAGEHHPYRGAPLHVHHDQDEWIYVLAGEFVAEVGGKRMRLKPGDSLLMPMKLPHRWSVAQEQHCGAIHLYSPAGLMEMDWSPVAQDTDPKNQEARKAEFEKHGLTLLGGPLSKEEIDGTA